jgi:outer membrane protein assembly factor BamB
MVSRSPVAPTALRLTAAALLALTLAGCSTLESLNPFGGDDDKPKLAGQRQSVIQFARKLTIDPALTGTPVVMPAALTNETWSQSGGTSSHAPGHLALSSNPREVWRVKAGASASKSLRYSGQPVIAGGRIYVLDSEGELGALDADTGRQVWRVRIAPKTGSAATLSGGIAFGDNRIYATSGQTELLALDPANGGAIWRRPLNAPARAAPTFADGRVFVTTKDNEMLAVDAATGRTLWNHIGTSEGEGVYGSPSPAADGNVVIAPYSSGELYAFRTETGRVAWADNLSAVRRASAFWSLTDIASMPVIDRNRAIAVSIGGRMVAIDTRSGSRVWQQELGSTTSPWSVGDYVFAISNDQELLAIDREGGGVRWIAQLDRYEDPEKREDPIQWVGPIVAGNRVWVASSIGTLAEISVSDGSIVRKIDVKDPVSVSPIVARGTLYVLTDGGELVAYR